MAELEEQRAAGTVQRKRRSLHFRGFGCLKTELPKEVGIDIAVEFHGERRLPTHLLIMVNGIIGNAQNWRYAANEFLMKYPEDAIVHCTERNPSIATFGGVDVMGDRLAEEVPLFCGFYTLEKVATQTTWFLGRTGKHLFLTDKNNGKPSLPLQMVSDLRDLKFISALKSFMCRVAYANSQSDFVMTFTTFLTSSLRPRSELPKHVIHLPRVEKYPHIINVENQKVAAREENNSADTNDSGKSLTIEEEMLRGLTKMIWERFDVNCGGSKQRFLAHSTIQEGSLCTYSSHRTQMSLLLLDYYKLSFFCSAI